MKVEGWRKQYGSFCQAACACDICVHSMPMASHASAQAGTTQCHPKFNSNACNTWHDLSDDAADTSESLCRSQNSTRSSSYVGIADAHSEQESAYGAATAVAQSTARSHKGSAIAGAEPAVGFRATSQVNGRSRPADKHPMQSSIRSDSRVQGNFKSGPGNNAFAPKRGPKPRRRSPSRQAAKGLLLRPGHALHHVVATVQSGTVSTPTMTRLGLDEFKLRRCISKLVEIVCTCQGITRSCAPQSVLQQLDLNS